MTLTEYLAWLEDKGGFLAVRVLPTGYWAAIRPFIFTNAICMGRIGDQIGYDDRWCYHDFEAAKKALDAWDGKGEPIGWHRHPATGRRVSEDGEEYIRP